MQPCREAVTHQPIPSGQPPRGRHPHVALQLGLKPVTAGMLLLLLSIVTAHGQKIDNADGQNPQNGLAIDDAIDPEQPLLITAETLNYDLDAGTVEAFGKVEISADGRRLLADRVIFNRETNRVSATGNITLIEPTGEAFFAEELELDGDLATGFANGLGVLLTDQSRIASARAVRREGRYTELVDAVYSPCETCRESDEQPIWQIRASRVIHDQQEQNVIYHHARLEIFGVPIAYAPYFSHPDPLVEKRTGFLAPSAGSDSELGLTLETPYHYVIADNRDVTFNPLFTTKGGTVLGITGRDLQHFGETELTTSFTVTDAYQRQPSDDGDNELRGHIDGHGHYRANDNVDVGFDIRLASDNSYLQRYDFSNDDVLQNRLYAERIENRDYLLADAYGFQGLRDFDEQGRIPIALPWLRARWIKDGLPGGSEIVVDGDALALTRTTGLDTRRLSGKVGWQANRVGKFGDLWKIGADLRGDLYQVDGEPQTLGEGGSNTSTRLLPRISADWSLPLAGKSGNWFTVIEPLVSATATVDDGNSNDIPNEDSIDFEFDDTNLFEADRFTGLDLYDGGTRTSFGVRFDSISDNGFKVGGLVGQSYRLRGDSAFSENSGVDSDFSDYVGRLNVEPNEFLNLSYRFRLSHDSLDFRRSDLRMLFGPKAARFNLGYLNISEDVLLDEPLEREELTAGVRLRITPELAAGFQSRIDLTEDQPVAHMVGLVYTDDCFVITMGLERRFTSRGELNDTTKFALRIGLRTLGEVTSDSDDLEN